MSASVSFDDFKRAKDQLSAMSTKADRIKTVRRLAGLTQEGFAKRLDTTRGAVGNWELGQGIKMENLDLISKKFGVSLDWLAQGKGDAPGLDTAVEVLTDESVERKQMPGMAIREIDVNAGMGGGGYADREVRQNGDYADPVKAEGWQFPSTFVRNELRAPADRIVVAECRGDSMAPTLHSGDRVILDTGHKIPTPDGIYCLRDRWGGLIVKRLQVLRRGDPPRVLIISDNSAHQNEEVGADEIEIVGRVVCALKML